MIDILFRKVFNQLYLRTNIFYHVKNDINCKAIQYHCCYDVDWLIKTNNIELLKYKLKNNEYLYFNQSARKTIYQLKDDIDVFIQCYKRLEIVYGIDTHQSIHEEDPLMLAAINKNNQLLLYLIREGNLMNESNVTRCLEYVLKMADEELCRECLKYLKYIENDFLYLYAIYTNNLEIIKMIFCKERKKGDGYLQFPSFIEQLLTEAMETGNIYIFIYIRNCIDNLMVGKKSIYNDNLLSKLLVKSIKSLEMFKYMFECCVCSNDTLGISNTFNIDVKQFSKLISTEFTKYQNPFTMAASLGKKDIIQYSIDKGIINDKKYIETIALISLKHCQFEIYELIQNAFNIPLTSVPSTFKFKNIDKLPTSIEQVLYIFEVLQQPVDESDLITSSMVSTDSFKYIYQRLDNQNQLQHQSLPISDIFNSALSQSNFEIPLFLFEQGICLDLIWSYLVVIPISNHNNNNYNIIKFIKTICTINPINYLNGSLIPALMNFIVNSNDFNLFKVLFDIVYPIAILLKKSTDIIFQKIFIKAVESNRIQVVKYLHKHGINLVGDIDGIMLQVAATGSLSMLKFVHENYQQSSIKNTSVIENSFINSILNNHLNCVEYLAPFFNYNMSSMLNYSFANDPPQLSITKFLFQHPQFKDRIDFKKIKIGSRYKNYYDVVEFLHQQCVFD